MFAKEIEALKYRSFDSLTLQEIWKLKKLGILNGCGGKGCIIRPPKAIFFEASCDKHDHGYWRGGDEKIRAECDLKFFYAMMRDCERLPPSFRFIYYTLWCLLYYYSVRVFGSKYFNYYK